MSARPTIRLVALAVMSVLLLGALPGAAHAQRWSHRDAVKDVAKQVWFGPIHKAPAEREGDIVATTVDHGKKRIVVRVDVRKLVKNKRALIIAAIATPTQPGLELTFDYTHQDVSLWDAIEGIGVDCPGLSSKQSYAHGFVSASFPRSCLGDPTWIKVSSSFSRNLATGEKFWDYGGSKSSSKNRSSPKLTSG